jgi:YcxB-like protein
MRVAYKIRRDDFVAAKQLFIANERPWYHRITRLLQSWTALYIWVATRWYFYRAYNTNEQFRHDFTADISPQDIRLLTCFGEDEIKWSEFVRYLESDKLLMLFVTEFKFLIFPKRAFTSGDLDVFKNLIQRNIGARKAVARM